MEKLSGQFLGFLRAIFFFIVITTTNNIRQHWQEYCIAISIRV